MNRFRTTTAGGTPTTPKPTNLAMAAASAVATLRQGYPAFVRDTATDCCVEVMRSDDHGGESFWLVAAQSPPWERKLYRACNALAEREAHTA